MYTKRHENRSGAQFRYEESKIFITEEMTAVPRFFAKP